MLNWFIDNSYTIARLVGEGAGTLFVAVIFYQFGYRCGRADARKAHAVPGL